MKKLCLRLTFLIFFAIPSVFAKPLFVFYDAGTVNALKPVMEALDKEGKDYKIIAFGAAVALLKDHPKLVSLTLSVDTTAPTWHRLKTLPKEDLDKIYKLWDTDGDIDHVVAGLSSMIEVQILNLSCKHKNKAYYDSFSVLGGDFEKILDALDTNNQTILVPSQAVKDALQKRKPKQIIRVVGQPTLNTWREEGAKKRKTLLYLGNYENNNNGYNDSFRLFINAIKDKDVNVFISIHPKVDGAFEKEIVKDLTHIQVINSKDFKTEKLVHALKDPILVTQRSTAGVQGYFCGYAVIYLDAQKNQYTNFLIEDKKVPQCFDQKSFEKALEAASPHDASNAFKACNIPENAVELILNEIKD